MNDFQPIFTVATLKQVNFIGLEPCNYKHILGFSWSVSCPIFCHKVVIILRLNLIHVVQLTLKETNNQT